MPRPRRSTERGGVASVVLIRPFIRGRRPRTAVRVRQGRRDAAPPQGGFSRERSPIAVGAARAGGGAAYCRGVTENVVVPAEAHPPYAGDPLPARMRLGIGAVVVLVLLAFAVTIGIGMLRGATGTEVVEPVVSASPYSAAPPGVGVYVHVAGAVRDAGLYRLEVGDRIADAVARAGGLADDAAQDRVNLARPVADGKQILVAVTWK